MDRTWIAIYFVVETPCTRGSVRTKCACKRLQNGGLATQGRDVD